MSDIPIRNGLKHTDALLPLLFNFALQYAIMRVQVNQDALKLNGTHHLVVYADDNIFGRNVHTTEKNPEALVAASKEISLEWMLIKPSIWPCLAIRILDSVTI